ncbi:hypothetical protein C8Q73DRAFT_377986 [Cubamyces lactineus]|nr:hypothetical protein C8Q73DRAFT_377986 [Cubamyces lactineus]
MDRHQRNISTPRRARARVCVYVVLCAASWRRAWACEEQVLSVVDIAPLVLSRLRICELAALVSGSVQCARIRVPGSDPPFRDDLGRADGRATRARARVCG